MLADILANDGVATVSRGDTFISYWKEPARADRWKWVVEQLNALIESQPAGVIYLTIILPSSSPPDSTLRALMQTDLRRMGKRLRRFVVVAMGDGVWLALVRTLVRATLLLSGQSKQQVVVGTLVEGLARVRDIATPSTPSNDELRTMIETLAEAVGR